MVTIPGPEVHVLLLDGTIVGVYNSREAAVDASEKLLVGLEMDYYDWDEDESGVLHRTPKQRPKKGPVHRIEAHRTQPDQEV